MFTCCPFPGNICSHIKFFIRVADLLLGGAVMNKVMQPYEAHIPYLLQLFIDYNLYGMNMLNVAAVKFRRSKKEKGV